jgi:protein-S-isoprenylcysteine O-methyltransferase Ste14
MEKKMSLMGVAGKIMLVLLISLAVAEGLSLYFSPTFRITENYGSLVIAAAGIAVVGFTLNLVAAFGMLKAHKEGRLATTGLYVLFLNPMYTFQLLLTVPGLLLLFNSWLFLLTIVPAFIAFKVYVKEEEKYLEEKFGVQYAEYREKVLFKCL